MALVKKKVVVGDERAFDKKNQHILFSCNNAKLSWYKKEALRVLHSELCLSGVPLDFKLIAHPFLRFFVVLSHILVSQSQLNVINPFKN